MKKGSKGEHCKRWSQPTSVLGSFVEVPTTDTVVSFLSWYILSRSSDSIPNSAATYLFELPFRRHSFRSFFPNMFYYLGTTYKAAKNEKFTMVWRYRQTRRIGAERPHHSFRCTSAWTNGNSDHYLSTRTKYLGVDAVLWDFVVEEISRAYTLSWRFTCSGRRCCR